MLLRSTALLFVFGVGLVLGLPPAAAGEEEEEPPPYGAMDLAVEDGNLPEGWKTVYDDVLDTPGEALELWVTRLAGTIGIDEDDLLFDTRILKSPDGRHVTLLLIEVDGDPGGLEATLEEKAKANGHKLRRMGYPTLLLMLAAPDELKEKVEAIQMSSAVITVSRLALERQKGGSRVGAQKLVDGVLVLEPEAAMPHAVLGLLAVDDKNWDEALKEFEKAFDPNGKHKPTGRLAMWGWRTYGYVLLQKKSKELDAKAVDAFEKAVALEKYAETKDYLFPARYNLACAFSRLGKTDAACGRLGEALKMAKERMSDEGFAKYVREHVWTDEDLENIRNADCYKAIMEKTGVKPLEEGEKEAGGEGGGKEGD